MVPKKEKPLTPVGVLRENQAEAQRGVVFTVIEDSTSDNSFQKPAIQLTKHPRNPSLPARPPEEVSYCSYSDKKKIKRLYKLML